MQEETKEKVNAVMRERFKPEFLNRVDETIQKKKKSAEDKQDRINEQLEVSDKIAEKAVQSSED